MNYNLIHIGKPLTLRVIAKNENYDIIIQWLFDNHFETISTRLNAREYKIDVSCDDLIDAAQIETYLQTSLK
jgi:hypothetical protein